MKAGGLAGSLTGETLDWLKSTSTVKGKTVAAISSVACSGSERPYSTTFTATLPTTNATGPVATRPRRRGRNVGK
jgi:hypothetical protein